VTAGVTLVAADGTPLALHDLGGSGQPVLFAHAAGFHGRIWGPVAGRLADRIRSWALDLRGHGDAGPCPPPADWTPFGLDVQAAAGALDSPLVGIGHSLGGAALLAAELAAPGTFSQLVLYEPAVSAPAQLEGGLQALFAAAARRRRATFPDHADAYQTFSMKPPTNVFADDALKAYVTYGFAPEESGGGIRVTCDPATEAAIYESAGATRLWDLLRPMECRTTLIRGADSDLWNKRTGDDVAGRLGVEVGTEVEVEVLPNAGHFGPFQVPDEFAGLLRAILPGKDIGYDG
jgi:pimeloyl-ACP methyl ester carboxylesterase